jgi:hypothetical protein
MTVDDAGQSRSASVSVLRHLAGGAWVRDQSVDGLEGEAAATAELRAARDRALDARADLGPERPREVNGPADIDNLRDPPKRLAAWRRLITDTVAQVTVPAG